MEHASEALDILRTQAARASKARRYIAGNHDRLVTLPTRANSNLRQLAELRDNLMPAVVRALASRIHVESWQTDHGDELDDMLRRNRWPLMQKELVREAVGYGDSGLVVWPGADGSSRLYPQKAGTFSVVYDTQDLTKITQALKVWRDAKRLRAALYLEDRVEQWVTKASKPELPENPDGWQLFEEPVSHNYNQVPFFHFGNDADLGLMGSPEIEPAMPLQDALNLSLFNLKVLQEDAAFPQRVRIGVEAMADLDTGEVPPPKSGPGTTWDMPTGGDVKQLPGQSFRDFIEEQNTLRRQIAVVTGTPAHMLNLESNALPSGEALKVRERTLTDKARDRQDTWEGPLADAVSLALHIDGVEGVDGRRPTAKPVWAAPETVAEADRVALVAQRVSAGWSRRQALTSYGLDERQVDELLAERAAEEEEEAARRRADFDAGLV